MRISKVSKPREIKEIKGRIVLDSLIDSLLLDINDNINVILMSPRFFFFSLILCFEIC